MAHPDSSIRKNNIQDTVLLANHRVKPVDIGRLGHITLHAGHVVVDLGYGFITLILSAARNEDVGASINESLRRG